MTTKYSLKAELLTGFRMYDKSSYSEKSSYGNSRRKRRGFRKYTEISELTYENTHEFIDRILIYETDKETQTRRIDIYYSFVGLLKRD